MKSPLLVLAFLGLLVAGCAPESVVGLDDNARIVGQAEDCGLDPKPC